MNRHTGPAPRPAPRPTPQRIPPGRIEMLGGREVHWVQLDGDDPPVLLLGGCGVPYTAWTFVTAELDGVRMILLDRPGMAGSTWPGRLPTLAEEVDTLIAMLERVGRPSVVVAHSMAGPHAEALARRRPDLVAGLVLLDASNSWHPRPSRFEQAWLRAAKLTHATMNVRPMQSLAVWLDRAMVSAQSTRTRMALMPPWAGWAYRDPDAVAMVVAEQAAYGRQLTDLSDLRAACPWPGTPTVVITATEEDDSGWGAAQTRYAALLRADHRILGDSGHMIMLDRPDEVVRAVQALRR